MNSQQSHQLQLQRDIIQEKKQELRQLNMRMAELGNALRRQHGNGFDPRRSLPHQKQSPGLFNGTYLQDTLSRRKHLSNKPTAPSTQRDVNSNIVPPPPQSPPKDQQQQHLKNGMVSGYSPNSKPQASATFENSPVSENQVWRNDPKKSLNFDTSTQNKPSPLHSPSSSVSSLSSLSSASATPDESSSIPNKSAFPFGKDPPPPPPTRTTPVVLRTPEPTPEDLAKQRLEAKNRRICELQEELRKNTNIPLQSYNDSALSSGEDDLKYQQYGDANNSCSKENLSKVKPAVKPKPPVIAPKPSVASKPKTNTPSAQIDESTIEKDEVDRVPLNLDNKLNGDIAVETNKEELVNVTEPDEFELSFADIDEINDMQTDVWSNSDASTASQSSYDSDVEGYTQTVVVPVVISVSPDKMPPPILMKPDKPRRPKRNVVLDPFALLLDAALEGEMETVKRTLTQVRFLICRNQFVGGGGGYRV